jgi:hypothetical protein
VGSHYSLEKARVIYKQLTRKTVGEPRVEAGYNISAVVPANRKRRQKGNTVSDEEVKYSYWALIT